MHFLKTIFIFFILGYSNGYAQQVTVLLDKNNILIGEQINLAVKMPVPNLSAQVNLNIPDSIPHFEIISTGNAHNVKGENVAVQKDIIFTSFDSGSYTFPSLKIVINDNGKINEVFSPAILINVGYAKEDSLGIRDLKPLRLVKVESKIWLYIIAAIISILLLILLYKYLNKKKDKNKENEKPGRQYQEAIEALDKLENSDVDSKLFHSSLVKIFQNYYSSISNNNMLVKTTGDILVQLKNDGISSDLIKDFSASLRLGDAVKYAKFKSVKTDHLQALNYIRNGIETLNKNNAKD